MKTLVIILIAAFALQAQSAIAVVRKARGEVMLTRNGKDLQVKRGMRVYNDDELQTRKRASVSLIFLDDKSLVRVRQNSIFKVKGTRDGSSIAKNVVMEIGDVFASVAKQKGEFRVETPTSVASVKGTEFSVNYSNGVARTFVYQGSVEVANKNGQGAQTIGEGKKATVGNDGNVSVEDMTEEEKSAKDVDDFDIGEIILEFQDENGNKKNVKLKISAGQN